MYKRAFGWMFLAGCLCLIGCAGTSGGGVPGSQFRYTANVGQGSGVVSLEGFRDITYQILEGRYQYVILRFRELGNRLTFETDWQNRAAFQDEVALGAQEAKTKIYGDAKYIRLSGSGATKVTAITLRADNMLLMKSGAWELQPCTPQCKEYLRDCFNKLESEVISKMRPF
ncbi:hypothetical protein MJD09_26270 [bacterium]|nr:hypothetical protein [bacterium]